jgi:hypothetical protein
MRITKHRFFLTAIIILYIVFKWQYIHFVPLFDGFSYAGETIYDAVSQPFNLVRYNTAGHTSMVYVFLISLLQRIDLGNTEYYHVSITLLGILSIFAFWGIATYFFGKPKNQNELYILTILYAFFPIISASVLHVNVDYGVMVFFLYFLYFFLNKKYFIAMIMSVGLIFSKEIGIVVYGATLLSASLIHIREIKKGFGYILGAIIKKSFLIIPILLLFSYYLYLYLNKINNDWFGYILKFSNRLDSFSQYSIQRIQNAYYLGIFIINFNWILSLFIVLGIGTLLLGVILKKKDIFKRIDLPRILFLLGIFIISFFGLTLYKTYINLRYFLSLYPLLILLFYFGIFIVIPHTFFRRLILCCVTLLFIIANFRTYDLISKKIYGTFLFGNHQMLVTTSITKECCGYGRDQLVYNLEYTHLHYLLNKIAKDIKPDDTTTFAYDPVMHPLLVSFDRKTYERTLRRQNRLTVNFMLGPLDPNYYWKPQKVYYIEIPITDTTGILDSYTKKSYSKVQSHTYQEDGYWMKVTTLQLKQ